MSKEIVLNVNGNKKQLEAVKFWIDKTTIDIAYGGSKGSGKSFLGCSLICGDALIYPETHYFIARKKLTDLRKFTIPSIHEVLTFYGISQDYYTYNGQDNYFKFYNGSKIFLLDAKKIPSDPNYMRFGSMQMTRGWIEESGEFEEECKNNLQASIGRWKNQEYGLTPKLLQTCNPSKNYLYEKYYKLSKENKLPNFQRFIQALPSDNKMLEKDYITNLLKILSPNEAQRLVYGNWEYDDNPYAMFDYSKICDLFTNSGVKSDGKRYMSCDIAYMGADIFTIGIWEGFRLIKVYGIEKIDETAIGTKIKELSKEHNIPYSNIVYDADGLRSFTRNSLVRIEGAKPFVNNSKPLKSPQYRNLKSECAFMLRDHVERGLMFIEDLKFKKQIISDLEQICRMPLDDEGKISLESKSKFKERTSRSPDFFDMLLMRFVFELKKSTKWL